jgi:hypothetical protein
MHIMLQQGGWKDGYDGDKERVKLHDEVKDWIRSLPPEASRPRRRPRRVL